MTQLSSTPKVKPIMAMHQHGIKSAREEIYYAATSGTLVDCSAQMF